MRTIWTGSISFGLVNIPVRVVGAVRTKDIKFHLLHGKDGGRIRFRRTCSVDGKEVPQEDIVKGFEVARGQYVTFTDEELKAIDPEATRTIDIQDFVPLRDIDPAHFDKPYYLVPDKNADRPYALFVAALERAGRVGLANVVMHDKAHLVALRAQGGVVLMETLHHPDEIVPLSAVAAEVPEPTVDKRQLEMAEQLIASLSVPFDATRYKDAHRQRILAAVEAKAAGNEVVVEPSQPAAVRAVDLMEALEKSLAAAKTRRPAPRAATRPTKRPAAKPGRRRAKPAET